MRNIEKGLLLAEMFGIDCEEHVPTFINWIKSTHQYGLFLKRKNTLERKSTWSARNLYKLFSSIDVDGIKTIEDGMIVYGQISYLLKISDEESFTNPLIVSYFDNDDLTLGDIKIKYDNQIMTLRELSKLEGSTYESKYQVVDRKLRLWRDEVEKRIVNPCHQFENQLSLLPSRPLFTPFRIFEIVFILFSILLSGLFIGLKPYMLDSIPMSKNMSTFVLYLFMVLIVLSFIYLVSYLIIFNGKKNMYKTYIKHRNAVLVDIYKENERVNKDLRQYLLFEIANNGNIDRKLKEFSTIPKYLEDYVYCKEIIDDQREISIDNVTVVEKVFLSLTSINLITILLMIFLSLGGVL